MRVHHLLEQQGLLLKPARLAVGETVTLMHPPLPSVRV